MNSPVQGERPARQALEDYVEELHQQYEIWYAKSVRRLNRLWISLQVLALLVGFMAAVIAAGIPEDRFNGLWRAALIILPIIGSLASSALLQFRVYDLWRLREAGRVTFQDLVVDGRRRLAAATTAGQYSEIHADLQKRAHAVEILQTRRFFSLGRSDFVARFGGPAGALVPSRKDD